ncbi:MAG: hypothetical protein AB8B99_17915 [Phormidesmis sp.]
MDEAVYMEGLPEDVRAGWEAMPEEQRAAMQAHADAVITHQKNVIEPMLAFKYPERPVIRTVEKKSKPRYYTYEFEAIRLIDSAVETTHRTSQYFVETLPGDIPLEMVTSQTASSRWVATPARVRCRYMLFLCLPFILASIQ